jgi:receptor protein-tyrosine kinase
MPTMIPRTIVARPEELSTPDILPLPGSRRPERDVTPPPRQPSAASGGSEFGPRDILNALRYHSVLFVTLGTLVAAGLFAAGWMLVPPKYTTYATLFVDQRNPVVVPSASADNESGNFAIHLKTTASQIKSRKTIGGALMNKNGIAQLPMLRYEEDPPAFLEEKLVIDLTDTSNSALRVSLSGDDPVQITSVLNAVVDYFMEEVGTLRVFSNQRIEALRKKKTELEQLRDAKLKHWEEQIGKTDNGEPKTFSGKLRVSEYVDLVRRRTLDKTALANARALLATAQSKVEQHDANPPPMPIDDLTPAIDRDAEVFAKEVGLNKLKRDLKAIESQSQNPYTPSYFDLKRRVATTEKELAELRQLVKGKIEVSFRNMKRADLLGIVEKAQAEVQRLERVQQADDAELASFKDLQINDEVKVQSMALSIPEDDAIRTLRAEIEKLGNDIIVMTANLDAPDRVRVWHKAEVPSKKDIRKQAAVSGAAGLMGLGLVGGLISVYELRRKRVFGPTDPIFRQKLPLLGCLPDCASPASAKVDAVDPAGRSFFEAVDKVKAVLCRQMQRRHMQSVLVTSAAPREGKSALAWHLALSLARSDRRTLFIDGNLRSPGLHNHFDIASHPGLSELLRNERTVNEVIQRTALDNLWCIAAGVCDENARQALDKDSLRQMLERSRRDFDYIVIDACSIREAVDPLYLAQRADAVVLSVRSFESGTADVDRACERLSQLGTPVLGAVLTDPTGASM